MKKYIVESWFKMSDQYDTKEDAERQAQSYKKNNRYRETRIITLEQTNIKDV